VDEKIAAPALPDDAPIDRLIENEQVTFTGACPQATDLVRVRLSLLFHIQGDLLSAVPKGEVELLERVRVVNEIRDSAILLEMPTNEVLTETSSADVAVPVLGATSSGHRHHPAGPVGVIPEYRLNEFGRLLAPCDTSSLY
jgi:hypothetical protein